MEYLIREKLRQLESTDVVWNDGNSVDNVRKIQTRVGIQFSRIRQTIIQNLIRTIDRMKRDEMAIIENKYRKIRQNMIENVGKSIWDEEHKEIERIEKILTTVESE